VDEESVFRAAREAMVHSQIEERGIRNPRLLAVMRHVPRHRFVQGELRERAYEDGPLPIGSGQTISQPYIVAAMTDLLELMGDENVLEIGTGSGYQAAVFGEMAHSVHTVERHPALAQQASAILAELGYQNIFVHVGDGSLGWAPGAPYEAIAVTAAAPEIPTPLINQLAEGGRLVIPVGNRSGQMLERWRKHKGRILREKLFQVAFVPLRGQHGWNDGEWE
jgi:protein-L-isoaspartate(D-aspartate) O-methyltransferase